MNNLPFEKVEREILVKKEAKSEYGCKPEERKVEDLIKFGVVCVNKPQGPTSHQISDYVKKIFNISKAGHSGSLDPNVTGVLPVALDRSTRVVEALLKAGKEYVCLMHLHDEISEDKIRAMFVEFSGKIRQLPPKKCAVKRVEREREIYYVDVLEIDGRDVLFIIGCEAGTYIRKFCFDFGLRLNSGAHMQQLVRTKAGPFSSTEMYSLYEIKDAYEFYRANKDDKRLRQIVKPMEYAVSHLGKIYVLDSCVDSLCCGASLSIPGISKFETGIEKGDMIAIFSLKNELVGIGDAVLSSDEIRKQDKGIVAKNLTIFMERGKYPKFTKN